MRTLDVVRRLRARVPRIGVALQAYLHRTSDDAARDDRAGIGIRLVKGAYSEPPSVAFPKKADVDANYVKLARLMMSPGARASGSRAVFGTHDTAIIKAIEQHGDGQGLAPTDYEVHMLYGIQRGEQRRLARDAQERAGAHRLRHLLVPLVHAAAGRAAGQRLVRGQERLPLEAFRPFARQRGDEVGDQ